MKRKCHARDLMQSQLVTISPSASLADAARLLTYHHISGLPVVNHHGLAEGVLTLHDLVAAWGADQPALPLGPPTLEEYLEGFYPDACLNTRTVGEVMTRKVLHVDEKSTIPQMVELMLRHGTHRVFVSRRQRLVGVVSMTDIVRTVLNHDGREIQAADHWISLLPAANPQQSCFL